MSTEEVKVAETANVEEVLDAEVLAEQVKILQKQLNKANAVNKLLKENQDAVMDKPVQPVPVKTEQDIFKEYLDEVRSNKSIFDPEFISDYMWQDNGLPVTLALENYYIDNQEKKLEDVFNEYKNDLRWKKYYQSKISNK